MSGQRFHYHFNQGATSLSQADKTIRTGLFCKKSLPLDSQTSLTKLPSLLFDLPSAQPIMKPLQGDDNPNTLCFHNQHSNAVNKFNLLFLDSNLNLLNQFYNILLILQNSIRITFLFPSTALCWKVMPSFRENHLF